MIMILDAVEWRGAGVRAGRVRGRAAGTTVSVCLPGLVARPSARVSVRPPVRASAGQPSGRLKKVLPEGLSTTRRCFSPLLVFLSLSLLGWSARLEGVRR